MAGLQPGTWRTVCNGSQFAFPDEFWQSPLQVLATKFLTTLSGNDVRVKDVVDAPSFASLSTFSLPTKLQCPGTCMEFDRRSFLWELWNRQLFFDQVSASNAWPWQVSWQQRICNGCEWKHLCGATLLGPRWVVTAGHCIEEWWVSIFKAYPILSYRNRLIK